MRSPTAEETKHVIDRTPYETGNDSKKGGIQPTIVQTAKQLVLESLFVIPVMVTQRKALSTP